MRCYQVDLYFRGPLLFKASGTLALGIDAAMQTYRGQPVLMGSALRGNVRHALQDLLEFADQQQATTAMFDRWFGAPSSGASDDGGNYDPVRRQVHFDFVWKLISPGASQSGTRTRILIDEKKGTVADGALQTIEDRFAFNADEEPHFRGMIRVDPSVEEAFGFWLERALCMIPAIGSNKGIGFGQLADFRVSQVPMNVSAPIDAASLSASDTLGLSFSLDRPLCLGAPRTDDSNLIVSDEIITGNVIKAVIARQVNTAGTPDMTNPDELCFDQIRISHCLPAVAEAMQRRAPMPHSVACLPGNDQSPDRIVCAAHRDPAQPWSALPAFQADRKPAQSRACERALGLAQWEQQRLVLVRTQIERSTGTSQEAALFSIECVEPLTRVHTDQAVTESVTRWCGNVDLRGVPPERRSQVRKALIGIFDKGLQGIGRTGACTVDLQLHARAFAPPEQSPVQVGEMAVVMLLSAARLFVPGWERGPSAESADAQAHYRQYWDEVSNRNLRLHRFFATQTLRGGVYHHWRFQHGQPYAPQWLTTPGSVFVLEVLNDDGKALLECWDEQGLPLFLPFWHVCDT